MKQYRSILFICKDNPFGWGGGNYATHAYLKALSDLSDGNIDVFISKGLKIDPELKVRRYYETPERGVFSRLLSFFTGHLHRHVEAVSRRLHEADSDYDLIVFNNSKTSTGLLNLAKKKGIDVVTIHHNVELEFVRDNTTNPILRKIMLHHVTNAERMSYLYSDYNLFLTQQDMNAFHRLYGESKGKEGVIGAFEVKELPEWKTKKVDLNHLVFAITGSLCTVQGVDGICYFFEELYKYIPKGAGVIISGRQPTKIVFDLCNKYENVRLVANPADMADIINQADIYLCPTRLGGGLKLRVMDGLKLGIPVLSHSCSARGYDAFLEGDYLTVFSNAEEFGKALEKQVKMLKEGRLGRKEVRRRYEELFSYEAGYKRVKTILYEDRG